MKNFIRILLSVFFVLVMTIIFKTLNYKPQVLDIPKPVAIQIDTNLVKNRLSEVLKFKTISNQDPEKFEPEAFIKMQSYLEQTFPLFFSSLEKEVVNQYSIIMKWPGKNPALKPILFMAHQDVVPVPEENIAAWSKPPFGGVIDDKYIWGRGALDDKSSLTGIFEAVTFLLKENFQPQRTFYFVFGHDEEVGGIEGAAKIAELMKSRGIELEFTLDEGGIISRDMLSGVEPDVALVGIAEKGYVSLKLSLQQEGGHSSMPPKQTVIGTLSQAIVDLEANPMPADLNKSIMLFDKVGPYMAFGKRLLFANTWFFRPLIERALGSKKTTNAMIRTTTAATIFNSGIKENVLPTNATAIVNFRILPGDTPEKVKQHVIDSIDNPEIKVTETIAGRHPSRLSDPESASFQLLNNTIHQANGDGNALIVAPFLVMAGTDSKYFEELSENVYRFLFNYATPDDIKRIHSVNERISIDNYTKVIRFYYLLIKNSDEL